MGPPLPTRRSRQAQRTSYTLSSKTLRLERRTTRTKPKFRAARQIEILSALHEDRSSSCASAYCGAYRRAFTASGNRTNRRTNRRADTGARHGAAGLASLTLHRAFIINRDSFTTRCPEDILYVSSKVGGAPIAQQNSVEIERHLGPARDLTRAVHPGNMAFDAGSFVLARRPHRQGKAISLMCFLRAQIVIQNGHHLGSYGHDEIVPGCPR